jgi:hypothetical protein
MPCILEEEHIQRFQANSFAREEIAPQHRVPTVSLEPLVMA